MKIAICDDNRQDLLHIASLVETYRNTRKTELTYVSFQNATELLSTLEGGNYDVLLLDVLMPGINGIQAAREIREQDEQVKIIFLTSSPEFAVESYSVQAYYSIL
jgi:DNA-binding LytR/AlgR family response regulator